MGVCAVAYVYRSEDICVELVSLLTFSGFWEELNSVLSNNLLYLFSHLTSLIAFENLEVLLPLTGQRLDTLWTNQAGP